MENQVVNNSPVTPASPQVASSAAPVAAASPTPTQAPGSKTDSELLLKSLQEEREKRREAEAALAEALAANPPATAGIVSDEGQAILKVVEDAVKPLRETIANLTEQGALKDLYLKYPLLKEVAADFDSYRQGFPGVPLENVAKAFLAEKGLSSTTPERKGLESPSGGVKTQTPSGMTAEEVANLRINNYPEYLRKIKTGEINPKDIR